jgi:hypothetical protein
MEGKELSAHGGVGKVKVDVTLDAQLNRLTDFSRIRTELDGSYAVKVARSTPRDKPPPFSCRWLPEVTSFQESDFIPL